MMAVTGTGRNGKVYEYYACASRTLRGAGVCGVAPRVPRSELDGQVLSALSDRLLTGDRLREITEKVSAKRADRNSEENEALRRLKTNLATVQKKLDNLINAVIEGTLSASSSVRARQAGLEDEKGTIETAIKLKTSSLRQSTKALTAPEANRLAAVLREKLANAAPELRRRYVGSLVGRVEVGADVVVVTGTEDAVSDLATTDDLDSPPVQFSVREWRTERNPDSGPLPPRSDE